VESLSPSSGARDLKGRRVLITGGLGFIGSNLAHACHARGADVTLYDCLDPNSGGNPANIAEIREDVRILRDDIRNQEGLCGAVPGHDIVFHCAAYTSHPHSMKEPHVDVDVNCKGTLNLLEALRRFNPGARLVHVGTSTQTGPMLRDPIDENHPEFPSDIYSANKSVSEKYVLVYGRAYGLRATVVRLSNTYGPRSNIRNPDLGFMNYFVGLALQGRELRVFGDGGQARTVVYVADAVDSLIRAAVSPRAEGRVYFAAGNERRTVAEIARGIAEVMGGTVRFVDWPANRGAIEIGDALIDSRRIREELGASFPTNLGDGLARTREYFAPRLGMYL
jgi:UDP-glucose 4-epimerase